MLKPIFILIISTLLSTYSFAKNANDKSLLQNGLNAQSYLNLGLNLMSIESDESSSYQASIALEIGIRLLSIKNNNLNVGYYKKGFHHGHSNRTDYKFDSHGISFGYSYTGFDFMPHLTYRYLTTVKEDNELKRKSNEGELEFLLAYKLNSDHSVYVAASHRLNQTIEASSQDQTKDPESLGISLGMHLLSK